MLQRVCAITIIYYFISYRNIYCGKNSGGWVSLGLHYIIWVIRGVCILNI